MSDEGPYVSPETILLVGAGQALADAAANEAAKTRELESRMASMQAQHALEADSADFRAMMHKGELRRELEHAREMAQRWKERNEEKKVLWEKAEEEKRRLSARVAELEKELEELRATSVKKVSYQEAEIAVLETVVAEILGNVEDKLAQDPKLAAARMKVQDVMTPQMKKALEELALVAAVEGGMQGKDAVGEGAAMAASLKIRRKIREDSSEKDTLVERELDVE